MEKKPDISLYLDKNGKHDMLKSERRRKFLKSTVFKPKSYGRFASTTEFLRQRSIQTHEVEEKLVNQIFSSKKNKNAGF